MPNLSGSRLGLRSLCARVSISISRQSTAAAVPQCGASQSDDTHTPRAKARRVRSSHAPAYVALLCTLILICPYAPAQTGFASISGRVADSSGAVIPKADVSLKNLDTGVSLRTTSNNEGIYSFPSVQPGKYVMHVERQGFRSVDVTGLTVYTQDQLARNFSLAVGSTSESVTVSANTTNDSPAVSTVVTREFVENMPLNGRSFQDLIALAPGTVSSADSSVGGTFNVNGQRDDANYFMVDGVSGNISSGGGSYANPQSLGGTLPAVSALGTTQALLSVDALEEFRIQTSGYTAEYGRQPGGEVQLTSRSGTNEWNGTAFDYLRNTVFDANSWFNNFYTIPRGAERQNDFGGTLGGPVEVPKLYNGKNRTFFFFSYEGLRLLIPNLIQTYVPSEALRASAAPGLQPILNAFPVANGPANTADGCTVDSTPSGSPCDALFIAGNSNPSNLDALSLRLDQNLGARLRLFGRYARTPSSSAYRSAAVNLTSTNIQSITAGVTAIVTTHAANDFRFNYSQSKSIYQDFLDSFYGAVPFAKSLIVPPQYVEDGTYAGSGFVCIPGSSLCSGLPYQNTHVDQNQYNLTDGLSLTRGAHTLKVGLDYRRLAPYAGLGSYADYAGPLSLAQVLAGQGNATVQVFKGIKPRFTFYRSTLRITTELVRS